MLFYRVGSVTRLLLNAHVVMLSVGCDLLVGCTPVEVFHPIDSSSCLSSLFLSFFFFFNDPPPPEFSPLPLPAPLPIGAALSPPSSGRPACPPSVRSPAS